MGNTVAENWHKIGNACADDMKKAILVLSQNRTGQKAVSLEPLALRNGFLLETSKQEANEC